MAGYFLPNPRFEQPTLFIPGVKPTGLVKIDWEHPLSVGLSSFGIGPVDLAHDVIVNAYNNEPDIIADYYHFNDTRNSEAWVLEHLGSEFLDGAANFTMLVVARFHGSNNSAEDSLIGQWAYLQGTIESNAKRAFIRYDSNSNEIDMFCRSGAADNSYTESVSIEDDKFHTIVGRLENGEMYIFVDGVKLGTGNDIGGGLGSDSHSKYFEVMGGHGCTYTDVYNDSPRFDLKAWSVWERALTDIELLEFHRNPYQFLIPA